MGLRKGHTNNPNGRPQGSRNSKSKAWDALGESIVSKHAERFNNTLAKLDDASFIKAYTGVLGYFRPKYSRSEILLESEPQDNNSELDYSKLKDETLYEIVDILEQDGDIPKNIDVNNLSFETLVDLVRAHKPITE